MFLSLRRFKFPTWALALMFVSTSMAQTETNQVHLAPNSNSLDKMKNTSLNNRNNTLFSSVDLVLVPVTVSDFGGSGR